MFWRLSRKLLEVVLPRACYSVRKVWVFFVSLTPLPVPSRERATLRLFPFWICLGERFPVLLQKLQNGVHAGLPQRSGTADFHVVDSVGCLQREHSVEAKQLGGKTLEHGCADSSRRRWARRRGRGRHSLLARWFVLTSGEVWNVRFCIFWQLYGNALTLTQCFFFALSHSFYWRFGRGLGHKARFSPLKLLSEFEWVVEIWMRPSRSWPCHLVLWQAARGCAFRSLIRALSSPRSVSFSCLYLHSSAKGCQSEVGHLRPVEAQLRTGARCQILRCTHRSSH